MHGTAGKGDVMSAEGVCFPEGFAASGMASGIKHSGKKDIALIYSETPCVAAACCTTNRAKSFSLLWSMKRIHNPIRAVLINSGNANALGGPEGWNITCRIMENLAGVMGISQENLLCASTGLIGRVLPEETILRVIPALVKGLSRDGGMDAAQSIITTDRHVKQVHFATGITGMSGNVKIGAMAKGAGMICPNMATMLAFITTDANILRGALKKALSNAVSESFNMITVDGDQSTNDFVVCLANGQARNSTIREGSPEFVEFSESLLEACCLLAKMIAGDGEGATKRMEVIVEGAWSKKDARRIAKKIAGSNLVKAAFAGSWPNWGRIAAACGSASARCDFRRIRISIGSHVVYDGAPVQYCEDDLRRTLSEKEVVFKIDLKQGNGRAVAWGCDLTEDYVRINMEKE